MPQLHKHLNVVRHFMTFTFEDLTKDITHVDIEDVLSCLQWKVGDMKGVVLMTVLGDLFLLGQDDGIYWLQTESGDLTKVADSLQHFEEYLNDDNKLDVWLLPSLVARLIKAGKTLKENEVYSFIKSPVIGGEYSVENIIGLDIGAHFSFTGQFCEQIKDLPDGTAVSVKFKT